jgi:hypothetical protein
MAEVGRVRVVQNTDPAAKESELLEEMDALEYEAGLLYFQQEDFGCESKGDKSNYSRGAAEYWTYLLLPTPLWNSLLRVSIRARPLDSGGLWPDFQETCVFLGGVAGKLLYCHGFVLDLGLCRFGRLPGVVSLQRFARQIFAETIT